MTSGLTLRMGYQASGDQWVKEGACSTTVRHGAEAEQGERLKSQTVKEAPGHSTERVGFREEREGGSATRLEDYKSG